MSEPCDWLAILDSAVVSVLRANWCRLGMRFGGGTNANTHADYWVNSEIRENPHVRKDSGSARQNHRKILTDVWIIPLRDMSAHDD